MAAESILFSFALASRIQILKQERAAALEHADREKSARLKQVQASAEQLSGGGGAYRRAGAGQPGPQRTGNRAQTGRLPRPADRLPNRRYLIERVEAAIAEAARRGESIALLLIDLDHFKPINDGHGHDAGDLLLRTLGQMTARPGA